MSVQLEQHVFFITLISIVAKCGQCWNLLISITVRELWRLRLNWLFLILTSTLVAANISSVTSFHQFTTNPTPLHSTSANMSSSRVCVYVHVYVYMLDSSR